MVKRLMPLIVGFQVGAMSMGITLVVNGQWSILEKTAFFVFYILIIIFVLLFFATPHKDAHNKEDYPNSHPNKTTL